MSELTIIFVWFHEKSNLSVVVNVADVDGPVRVGDEDDLNQNLMNLHFFQNWKSSTPLSKT